MISDLNAILTLYPSIAQPTLPPEPLGNAGGLSGARLWRYRSGLGLLVARAWPPDGPDRAVLEEIHAWLSATDPLGFVPVPIPGRDGRTLYEHHDRLWEITPWMPGAASANQPSSSLIRAGFAALAAFHQRLAPLRVSGNSPGILARLREIDHLLGGGFTAIAHALDMQSADPLCPVAREWLGLARGAAASIQVVLKREACAVIELQPCLRDVRPDHLLFTGDRLTGLIDFGAMGIDTVAGDLARLASEWLGRDLSLRASGVQSYAGIRPISATETALIDVFERSALLLGGAHWIRWHFLERRAFTDPTAVARGLEKGLERLKSLVGI